MAVTPRNIRAARNYAQGADIEALICRTRRRHRFPPPTDLGLPGSKVRLEPPNASHPGIYEMYSYCPCGAYEVRSISKADGTLARAGRVKLPEGYVFTDGEGYPMDVQGVGQCTLELLDRVMDLQRERETAARKRLSRK